MAHFDQHVGVAVPDVRNECGLYDQFGARGHQRARLFNANGRALLGIDNTALDPKRFLQMVEVRDFVREAPLAQSFEADVFAHRSLDLTLRNAERLLCQMRTADVVRQIGCRETQVSVYVLHGTVTRQSVV